MSVKHLRGAMILSPLLLALGGCHSVLLDPSGDVARQQSDLMIASAVLMALIIIPVLIAIGAIAWRYRASNKRAKYDPEWEHSTSFELVVWAWPLLIIIALGAMSWIGTHQLDPYQRLSRINDGQSVNPKAVPLQVDVVSLRWKWLFIYPQYGIATVNQMAAPVNRPIRFKLTSEAMMDSFFVPALAGQIYTMPGMQTVLNAVINKPGNYKGFSANYSGLGFTDMRFRFLGMDDAGFQQWVAKVRASGQVLDRATYTKLAEPSRAEPVHYYAGYMDGLYNRILNRCVQPGQMCMSQMMAIDAKGGRPVSDDAGKSAAQPAKAAAHGAATH